MNSKDYLKKIQKAYLKDFEEAYDKYVDLYNSKNSLLAFSELSNIYDGVSKIREIKKSDLEMKLNGLKSSFLRETVRLSKDGWSTPPEDIEAEINKIDSSEIEKYFNSLLDDFYEMNDIEVLRKEIIEKLNAFGEFKENRIYSDSLDSALNIISELQKIIPNQHSLRFLNQKILIEKYPEKIAKYSKLSGKEKQEITKVGNRDWIEQAYTMPEGFYDKARIYTKKEKWDQRSIYDQLITDFKNKWNGKKPSFTTVHRRLKENNIW